MKNASVLQAVYSALTDVHASLSDKNLDAAAHRLPALQSSAHEAGGTLRLTVGGRQTNLATYCSVVANTLAALRSLADDGGHTPQDVDCIVANRLLPLLETLGQYEELLRHKYPKVLAAKIKKAAPSVDKPQSIFFSLRDAFAQAAKDLKVSLKADVDEDDIPQETALSFDFEGLRADVQKRLQAAYEVLHDGSGLDYTVFQCPLVVSFDSASAQGLQALGAVRVAGCHILHKAVLVGYVESRAYESAQRQDIWDRLAAQRPDIVDVLVNGGKMGRVLRAKGFPGLAFLWVCPKDVHAALSPFAVKDAAFA